jgi:hypothetical protein
MFKVKAKFIGTNSLGFISGITYEMILINQPHIGSGRIEITTNRHNNFSKIQKRLRCEYVSWESFIPNWEILNFESMSGENEVESHHAKVNNGLKQSVRDYKISKIIS